MSDRQRCESHPSPVIGCPTCDWWRDGTNVRRMTPEEHYAEAERLLALWDAGDENWASLWGDQAVAAAQVHATLALARPDDRLDSDTEGTDHA